jgi:hypothetical protein
MKKLITAGLLLGATLSATAHAQTATGPTVVELFTSQSCYSCPPAEEYLGELAKRPDVLALEYHVDYWDDLVYGAAGKWKDVHSSPAFTARQRVYAGNLPQGQSYTPQMVIDGQDFTVGSNERKVTRAMMKANRANHRTVNVAVANQADGKLSITLSGKTEKPMAIWLVRFTKAVTTRVRAGENKGKTLTNHHIVTDIKRVAGWTGDVNALTTGGVMLKPGEGCAVLVQDDRQGPIRGAAYRPGAQS